MKNLTIVVLSIIALIFVILTFTTNWLFIIFAAILSGINYRILMKKK